MTVDIATLGIRIDSSDARTAARDMENFRQAGSRAEQQVGVMSDVMKKLAGAFAAMKILDAASALVETQRTFDKLNSSLITATGSVANAGQAFAALQAFAASTPYGLNEVTKGFIQLRNLGLTPSEKALNSYGNTASAMGKSLNQMVEAVADAATGEFERLKEFGIRSKKNGDEISFTFQGVTTTIENNAAKIEQYLIGLGETKFAGGMELQAKTLDGAISNLGDTWESTKLKFSQSGFGDAAHSSTLALTAALADLGAILDVVTGAAKKEGEAVREASGLHAALTTVFETVSVLGVNVAYVFTQVGKELGGLAAQAAAVATGDLSLAKQIGVQMRAEAAAARVEVDAKTDAILGASAKARKAVADEATAKQAAGRDDLAQYAVKQQASEKSAEALKKEGDAAKKAAKEYSDLIDKINGKSSGQDADFQQNIARLKNGYDAGKQSLSEYIATVEAYIKQQKSSIDIEQEHAKAVADSVRRAQQGAAELDRFKASLAAASARAIEQAEQEADRNETLVDTFGMERSAIEALELARLQEHLAQRSSLALTLDEITETEKLIVAKQRSAAALVKFEELSKQKQFWIDVDRTAHDTFVSIMDGSKSAAERMKDTFKNIFFDWLYQMTLKPFIVQLQGSVTSGQGGMSSLLGSAGSAASGAGGIGSLLGSAGGALGMIGGIGTGALQTAGALVTGQIGLGSTVSAGLAALTSGSAAGISAGLASLGGAIIPVLGGVMAAVTVLSKAFGHGPREVTAQGVTGTFGADGFTGTRFEEWTKKGGWFSSDKKGVDTPALDPAVASQMTAAYKVIKDNTVAFAEALGAPTDTIAAYSKQIKVALTGDATKDQAALLGVLGEVETELATKLVPNLADLAAKGESAGVTLQRLAVDYMAIDEIFKVIGATFGAVGVGSLAARERLIALAGGLDSLGQQTAYFATNYFSEDEKRARAQEALTAELAALGQASIKTKDDFRDALLGIASSGALATEEGAKLYAGLLALAPAFNQVAMANAAAQQAQFEAAEKVRAEQEAAAEKVAAALKEEADARAAVQKVIDDANAAIQGQIDTILKARMTEAQVRALETKGMADSTVALYDRLAALKAEEKAVSDLVAGLKTILDARGSNADQMFAAQLGGKDLQGKIDLLKGEEKATWAQVGTGADSVAVLEKIKNLAFQRIELEGQLQEKAIAGLKEQYSLREKGLVSELDAMVKMRDYAQQLLSFTGGLKLGDLSALNPTDKLAEAESQYRALLARANGGDEAARSGLQGSAQAYLQLQKQYSGSTQAYVSTYAGVIQDLEKLAGSAPTDPQIENQKLQISTIQSTSAALSTTVKDTSAKQVEVLKQIDVALAKAQANTEAQIAQAGAANQALVEQLKKSHTKLAEIEARMARMEAKA